MRKNYKRIAVTLPIPIVEQLKRVVPGGTISMGILFSLKDHPHFREAYESMFDGLRDTGSAGIDSIGRPPKPVVEDAPKPQEVQRTSPETSPDDDDEASWDFD